jgi:hypothetical protein
MAMFSFFRVISLCCLLAAPASAAHLAREWNHTQASPWTEETVMFYIDTDHVLKSTLIKVPSVEGEIPWVCYKTIEKKNKVVVTCFYLQADDRVALREVIPDPVPL